MTTMTLEDLKGNAYRAFNEVADGNVIEVTQNGRVIARLSRDNLTNGVGIRSVQESLFYENAADLVKKAVTDDKKIRVSTGLGDKSILIEPVR